MERISVESLVKYMQKTVQKAEKAIKEMLPDKFDIIFDGWSSRGMHYVAMYVVFPHCSGQRPI
eukprot:1395348-Amorphochlora_amoeboformis.AAC.2